MLRPVPGSRPRTQHVGARRRSVAQPCDERVAFALRDARCLCWRSARQRTARRHSLIQRREWRAGDEVAEKAALLPLFAAAIALPDDEAASYLARVGEEGALRPTLGGVE